MAVISSALSIVIPERVHAYPGSECPGGSGGSPIPALRYAPAGMTTQRNKGASR